MGYSNWSDDAYQQLSQTRQSKSRQEIFTNAAQVDEKMSPRGITVRESRDSAAHPDSTSIVVAFDVTGSMGTIAEQFARQELGGLMRMLTDHGYIRDPQLLVAAVGDAYSDRGPLQVGQFESGLEMDMWLTRVWLEGGGGGQRRESYGLAHWFATHHTSCDCWEKRGKKGYLFTMGDEMPWDVPAAHVEAVFGTAPGRDFTMADVVAAAQKSWEVFHIVVAQGYHGKDPEVLQAWRDLLGERALVLPDSHGVCQLIATTIGVCERSVDLARARTDLTAMGVAAGTIDAVTAALTPVVSALGAVSPVPASGSLPGGGTGGGTDFL